MVDIQPGQEVTISYGIDDVPRGADEAEREKAREKRRKSAEEEVAILPEDLKRRCKRYISQTFLFDCGCPDK